MHPNLEITQENGIRRIVLNDTKTRNSLSKNMVLALKEAVTKDNTNKNLRCIIITAKGPVFSAGHNLKELHSDISCRSVFQDCNELMMAIVQTPVPVIAAVDGLAAAAGCQLIAQCDITVCTKRSTFSTPGAAFGIFCSTPGIPLMRSVGRKTAAYMLFTGHPLTAQEAYNAGLVSRITENDELEKEVNCITSAILEKSHAVISLGKKFFYEQVEMDLKAAYEKGGKVMADNLAHKDGAEGVKSFTEKRKPIWS
ncbi:enoyl-CoA hydratase domain-containing protein 3, mitochondrial isoform X2 [Halyomorpha halys]|nr:enoyl-CoA hydratase domain-containing protein 3, mitochondrial isoform X2 [Halyomorpha halys]